MSGLLNTTGAVSGVLGTTSAPAIGTGTDGYVFTATGAGVNPAWEAAAGGGDTGASAFLAGGDDDVPGWANYSTNTIMAFGVNGDQYFNIGGDFQTSGVDEHKYIAPAAGLYMFGFSIYTGNADSDNFFAFTVDGTYLSIGAGTTFARSQTDNDFCLTQSVCLNLSSGEKVDVRTYSASDYYGPQSSWWGCRIT
jgi:hypothetical protein